MQDYQEKLLDNFISWHHYGMVFIVMGEKLVSRLCFLRIILDKFRLLGNSVERIPILLDISFESGYLFFGLSVLK